MPVGLVAFGVRLNMFAGAQVLVNESALARRHRIERNGPTVAKRIFGGVVGLALEHSRPSLAIALGVDDDAMTVAQAGA